METEKRQCCLCQEFYGSFIIDLSVLPLQILRDTASVFYGLVTPCPYFSKSKMHKGVIIIVIFLFIFVFVFQFYKPQTFLAFLSFLNIVTISRNLWESVLDLSETSRRFNTNPDILLRNGIPVSHLLRIKDHWICEVNLPFLNILTLSNYPRYCNGLYKCYASRLTTLFE